LTPKRPLLIEINVPTRNPVEVEAVAWHVREVKSSGRGRKVWSIGMMISKAEPEFAALLPDASDDSHGSASDVLASELLSSAEPEAVSAQAKESGDTLQLFRIRVKAPTGSRTRTLTLQAVLAAEARALAESELGEAWVILEVKPA
jgi:hypothetical protein